MEEENCVFCKIVKGEVPAYKVYEDEFVLAFLDINPINDGHTLVIPKKHHEDFLHLDEKEIAELMHAVQKVAKAVKKATNADGINIGMNIGKAAGQIIFHAHVHVIPRFENDGYKHWERKHKDKPNFEEIAKRIKENFK